MTSVEDLASDSSQHVRAALGTQISGLAPILGKEELALMFCVYGVHTDCFRTITHLLPMFLQMLKDDFPDVRLHIISKLELVNKGKSFKNQVLAARLTGQSLASNFYHNHYSPQLSN